jgi:hypothetical protein
LFLKEAAWPKKIPFHFSDVHCWLPLHSFAAGFPGPESVLPWQALTSALTAPGLRGNHATHQTVTQYGIDTCGGKRI